MNQRERVLAALNWEAVDVVPFVPKPNHVPRDPVKLKRLKEMGMGLSVPVNVFRVETPHVKTQVKDIGNIRKRIFHTPEGDVYEKVRINLPSEGGERGDTWTVEHMFKNTEDYDVIKFMVEDKIYKVDYSQAIRKEEKLGGGGVIFTGTGYSPLMQLIVKYMGFQRLAVELRRHPDQIESLMEVIDQKIEEKVQIVAESSVKLVHVCGNIDGVLVNPKLFKKYVISRYKKYNEDLHRKGKITMTRMDGRLKCLKDLIPETELDAVQAFTPPPGGDLPIKEAKTAWNQELAIWVNIPEVVFYYDPAKLERFIRNLLAEASPGNGIVFGITETVPPSRRDTGLEVITKTIQKYGKFPILQIETEKNSNYVSTKKRR